MVLYRSSALHKKALSRTQQILQNSAYVMASRCEKGKDDAYLVTRSGRKITSSRKLLFDQVSPLHLLNLCLHMPHTFCDSLCCWLQCCILLNSHENVGVVLLQLQAHILFLALDGSMSSRYFAEIRLCVDFYALQPCWHFSDLHLIFFCLPDHCWYCVVCKNWKM